MATPSQSLDYLGPVSPQAPLPSGLSHCSATAPFGPPPPLVLRIVVPLTRDHESAFMALSALGAFRVVATVNADTGALLSLTLHSETDAAALVAQNNAQRGAPQASAAETLPSSVAETAVSADTVAGTAAPTDPGTDVPAVHETALVTTPTDRSVDTKPELEAQAPAATATEPVIAPVSEETPRDREPQSTVLSIAPATAADWHTLLGQL